MAAKPKQSYVRAFDGATMIEIEPGWYVNAEVWPTLARLGVVSCSKKEE